MKIGKATTARSAMCTSNENTIVAGDLRHRLEIHKAYLGLETG